MGRLDNRGRPENPDVSELDANHNTEIYQDFKLDQYLILKDWSFWFNDYSNLVCMDELLMSGGLDKSSFGKIAVCIINLALVSRKAFILVKKVENGR